MTLVILEATLNLLRSGQCSFDFVVLGGMRCQNNVTFLVIMITLSCSKLRVEYAYDFECIPILLWSTIKQDPLTFTSQIHLV